MDPENEKARELYSFLSSNEAKAKEMEDLAKAVAYSYKKGGIGRAAARELYGTLLRGSVTRMEGYGVRLLPLPESWTWAPGGKGV